MNRVTSFFTLHSLNTCTGVGRVRIAEKLVLSIFILLTQTYGALALLLSVCNEVDSQFVVLESNSISLPWNIMGFIAYFVIVDLVFFIRFFSIWACGTTCNVCFRLQKYKSMFRRQIETLVTCRHPMLGCKMNGVDDSANLRIGQLGDMEFIHLTSPHTGLQTLTEYCWMLWLSASMLVIVSNNVIILEMDAFNAGQEFSNNVAHLGADALTLRRELHISEAIVRAFLKPF